MGDLRGAESITALGTITGSGAGTGTRTRVTCPPHAVVIADLVAVEIGDRHGLGPHQDGVLHHEGEAGPPRQIWADVDLPEDPRVGVQMDGTSTEVTGP